jgi:ankyrin repeat protein
MVSKGGSVVANALTIVLGAVLGVMATALWQFVAATLMARGDQASDLSPAFIKLVPVYFLPALPGAALGGAVLAHHFLRRRWPPTPMATTQVGLWATLANYVLLALLSAFEPVDGSSRSALTRSLPEHFISAGLTTIPLWIALAWLLRLTSRASVRVTAVAIVAALVLTGGLLAPAGHALSVRMVEVARDGGAVELVLVRLLGARSDASDHEGRTALMFVAGHGRPALAQLLLTTGADPNLQTANGSTALHFASGPVVDVLVRAGADVNRANRTGTTPLVAAAEARRLDAVKRLRAAGARGEARFNGPMLEAAQRGDADGLRAYAYLAGDLYARDASGRTAFMWAVERSDAEMIRILGDAAGYAGPPAAGQTPTTSDTAQPAPAAPERITPLADSLLDEHGTTRLMRAAARGDLLEVRGLLAGRANPDARDQRSGFTSLHLAAQSGHPEVVAALIHGGATLEARSVHDTTPLMVAAQSGQIEAIKVLLRAGSDLGTRTGNGMTALALAAGWGQAKTVRFLAAVGADVNEADPAAAPLIAVVLSPNVDSPRRLETVKALLQAGADPKSRLRDGTTALGIAQRQGDRDVVKLLSDAIK